jgi:hypothetical protein
VRSRLCALLSILLVSLLFVPAVAAAPARTEPLAHRGSLNLRMPSRHVVEIGFHQANSHAALRMRPRDGRTMASRSRGTAPTTAVDVQVRRRTRVVSPVNGRVRTVSRYQLYGRTRDVFIEIVPDGHPRKRVVVLHTVSPRVEPGDRVRAGRTVIASRSRELPFGSQIDRYSGRRLPHVHIEVRRY